VGHRRARERVGVSNAGPDPAERVDSPNLGIGPKMRRDSIDRGYTVCRRQDRKQETENSAVAYEEQCNMGGDIMRALRSRILEGGMASCGFPSHRTASPGDATQALGKRKPANTSDFIPARRPVSDRSCLSVTY
jgi:hypothetical protein